VEEQKIREVLEKSGFPLELQAGSIIEKELGSEHNWQISYNAYYRDEEESKSREIDIRAMWFSSYNKDIEFRVAPTILVECKKSTNCAWVFFGRKSESVFRESLSRGEFFDTFQLLAKPDFGLSPFYTMLLQRIESNTKRHEFLSTSYCQGDSISLRL
jgi:hypothetical protein